MHRQTDEPYSFYSLTLPLSIPVHPIKKKREIINAMALTEPQISTLLGYIAEPIQNKVSDQNHANLKELLFVFKEVDTQRSLQMPSSIEQRWIDFLPWHSFN